MSEEKAIETKIPELAVETKVSKKKIGSRKWFGKIPKEMILSPGGIILLFAAIIIEVVDLIIPPCGFDLLIELIPELIFSVMLTAIAGVPFTAQIIPILIEKIPVISDIVPTFLFYFL